MKILFYIEPWIERDWPSWKNHWLPHLKQVIDGLNNCSRSYTFHFIVGNAQFQLARELFSYSNVEINSIDQAELKRIYPNYRVALDSWYTGQFSEDRLKAMQGLVLQKVDGFVPDIIWTFMSPVPFLSKLYPEAITLHQEVGALSGAFYPTSWFLDPYGVFNTNLISKFGNFLNSMEPNQDSERFLSSLKQKFSERLDQEKTILKEDIFDKEKFSHLVYLPLQYSGHFGTDSNCEFISQFDILCHVLDNLDKSIGLVTNEHVNPLGKQVLNQDTIQYLQKTYPNFIYESNFTNQKAVSQQLIDMSDAVISISSTLGLQALFWEKPLFTIGNSHLKNLSHGDDITKIGQLLKSGEPFKSRSAALYYLFTHYYIPHYPYFIDGHWLDEHLQYLYNNRQKIKDADSLEIFHRFDTDNKIIEHYSYQTDAIEPLNQKPSEIPSPRQTLKRRILQKFIGY